MSAPIASPESSEEKMIFIVIPVQRSDPVKLISMNKKEFEEDSLKILQQHVGGFLEAFPGHWRNKFTLYCNEEGQLKGLGPNQHLADFGIRIVGPGVLLRWDEEDEDNNVHTSFPESFKVEDWNSFNEQ